MPSICPVSVVIPTFNRANQIGRAIDSVLAQSIQPFEVIVVDDGSTDNTADVCRRFANSIRYVWQKNGGASSSRNHGIQLASAEWIAFLDSDDYWVPEHLERMAAAMRETSASASLYFADMAMPEPEGGRTLWSHIGFRPNSPYQLVQDASAWALMNRQPMMLQSSVISKHALHRVGGLDVRFRLIHDSYLFCKLGVGGAACAVAGIGCIQTSDDTSLSRLTSAIPLGSSAHVTEGVAMWRDILQTLDRIPPAFRRLVRLNAASAHLTAGKIMLRHGQWIRGTRQLFAAMATDPRLMWGIVRHRGRRGYERTVRPYCAETDLRGN
jgi:hypothetical protein